MCSPEKHSMKNSDNKNIFHLNEKNVYDKNVSYWLQIYFNWIKIYFDIMKKVISWKYFLLNTNLFWMNKNIFWYLEKKVI